jgi:hypothetical protein
MLALDENFLATAPSLGHMLLIIDEGQVVSQTEILCYAIFITPIDPSAGRGHVSHVYPVTTEGIHDSDSQNYAILTRDNEVTYPGDKHFKDQAEFEDYILAEYAKAMEKQNAMDSEGRLSSH